MDTVKPSLNRQKTFRPEDGHRLARALRPVRMLAILVLWLAAGAAMAQNFPDPLVNTAQVAVPANTSDPASGNNTATDSNALALSSDLSIVKTLTSASTAPAGSTVTYQIVVSNAGPSNVVGAIITDTVPLQLTNVNWTCVAAGTSSCGTTSGTGNGISLTADIDVGPANTITLTVTGTAPASGTIDANTATVAPPSGTTDPDPSDDSSTTPSVPVSAVSDLSLTKTLTSASPAPAGSTVTYQIVVGNAGPSDAIGATIVDTVPAELTGVSWTCAATGTSSCGAAGGTGNVNLIANVGVGAANTITITVTGTAPASGTIGANTATVAPPGGTTDPNPGDNTDTENAVPVTPTVSINSASAAEGDAIVFTISLSGPSASDVTVTLNTADGTAGAPGDYTAQSSIVVTIPAGSTSATVSVPTVEDAIFEGNEAFTATISNPTGAIIGTATGTGTIVDDDAQPTVSIDSPSAAEGDPMVFTVSLSNPSAGDVTVTLNTANGTAIEPGDYTAQTGVTVTIPAGSTSATVSVPTIEDALFEGDETFTATLSNPVGAALGTATGTGTITEDDAQPTVSIDSPSAAEGDPMVFTVSLSAASALDVTVTLNTADGTAGAPGDYTAQTGVTVTIPAGSTSATVSVPTVEDAIFEGNEVFTATISNPTGATIGTATGTGTITDDDAQPTVSIDSPSASEGDPMVFTVSLSNPSASDVTVTLNTANGTANAPGDYTAQTGVTVTIPAGSTSATVNVPTTEDAIFEGNETFTATLSNPVGAVLGTATGTGTITDDEAAPTLSIDDVSVAESAGTATFTVSLSGASAAPITVDYATANGTATAGSDYTASSGTLTFAPGITSQTIAVPIADDNVDEPDETFTVALSNASGATIADASGQGTIVDDEGTPTVSIDSPSASEGDPMVFTVTLSAPSATPVTVTLNTTNGTAVAPGDYTAQSGLTVTIPAGSTSATVSVPTIEDAIFEGNETFTATLSNPVGAVVGTGVGTATIVDDETVPVLSVADASAIEGSPAQVVVSLSSPSATDVTVVLNTGDGTATSPADYTGQTGLVVTIPAGQTSATVPIPTATDALFEGDETFTVTLSGPTGATLGDANATATITDDDAQPTVSIDSPSASEGDPMVFTVSLSNPSASDATVTLNTANGTAIEPGDYAAQTGVTVTIPADSTSASVSVPTLEDAIFEGNETFTATLSNPAGATLGTATGTATIVEDDAAPTLSIDDVSVSESAGTATFTASLSGASATPVTVDYATANGTATAGSDYTASSGTLTFAPGITSQTTSVTIANDTTSEADETYTVGLSNAAGAAIADNSGLGTIVDDDIRVIDAIADTAGSVPGAGGTNVVNVLTNDTLGGAPLNPAEVVFTPSNNGPLTINPDGSVDVAPNTPAGTYTATYQICEVAQPTNCDSATVSVTVVAAAVVANDDAGSIASGAAGGTAMVNVLGNDTVGGATATTTSVLLTQQSSSHANVTLDTASGAVLVAAGTPAGTYTLTYRICEALNPSNCATATVTVTVAAAAIVANDDNVGPIPGSTGGTNVANVLTNDTLGGAPIDPAAVVLTPSSSGPLTINPDGSVDVAPNTPAGTYTATYQVCERLNPSNCDSATVTITIAAAAIDAVDDNATTTPVNGSQGGTALASVLANDRLGGAAASPGNVTLSFVSSTHADLALDAGTGAVVVAANTPAGTYTLTYRICEQLNPGNCDTAVATVAVSAAVIAANDDAAGPITGVSGGTNVANVLANDTLGGTAIDLVMVVFTPGSSGPLTINPDGSVDVAPDTPTGNYTATYQICERLNPTNCASASVTVSVQGEPATLRLTKTAAQRTARIGDLVRYTLRIDNIGEVDTTQVELFDRLPEGFVLAANSLQVADGDANGALLNARPLRIGALDIAAGRSATVIYVLRVGAGVGAGIHTNHAVARDAFGAAISNEATADVEVVGDPMLDDSLIVGSVFGDANGNGRQDAGERGLPGVRLGTVEGLLIETDAYGRFHLAGIDGGRWARGRNFLIKVDASTLPPGSRFTTENPRVLRVTPGVPVRFDFGVQVPGMPLGGGRTEVDIDLGQVFFEGRSATVPAAHMPMFDRIAGRLREAGGGSVAITANADDMVLAFHRAEAVRDALDQRLSPELRRNTRIELRTQVDGLDALVTLDKDIGLSALLFDTDKSTIRSQYLSLLDAIAKRVEAMPNTVVAISGYADVRGTSEHNLRLSQRRADAVAREISAHLPAATRTCLRIEPRTSGQAAACPAGR